MNVIIRKIVSLRKDNKINGGENMLPIRKIYETKNENIESNIAINREINQGSVKMDSIRKINTVEHKKMQELQNKIIGQGNNIALAKGVIPDPRKRQFIKKGIMGIIVGIGIAIFSKIARADGGFINSADGTSALNFLGEGTITKPNQPLVVAYNSAVDSNVTGDGSTFTIIFDTEVTDQNADFDGTSTFTAPVTGHYVIFGSVEFSQIETDADVVSIAAVASNRRGFLHYHNYGSNTAAESKAVIGGGKIFDMDAADTLTIECRVSAMVSGKVVDVVGGAQLRTHISVVLVA